VRPPSSTAQSAPVNRTILDAADAERGGHHVTGRDHLDEASSVLGG
jgi:hypothetical protein